MALLAVHIYAGAEGLQTLVFYTKPLLLIPLISYVGLQLRPGDTGAFGPLMLAGIFFSWVGDVCLMFQELDELWFLLGLGAFLLAHIMYAIAATRTYLISHEIALLKSRGWVLVAVCGYSYYFFHLLRDHLGSMIGPVIVYTLAISAMLLLVLNRYGKVGPRSFWFMASGAVLFVASDSILAWNKFVNHVPHSHLLIMGTYGLAQWGIAMGAVIQIQHVRLSPNGEGRAAVAK